MKKRLVTIGVHVVLWLIFLMLPALFNPRRQGFGIEAFVGDILLPSRLINSILLIIIFYFNYLVAIPRLYFGRRYGLLFLWCIVGLGVFFVLNYITMPARFHTHRSEGVRLFGPSFNLFMFLVVYVASYAACIYDQWRKVKEEKLNAEIAFLKAQINPHFLFNTLNSIYSLAITGSDKTADAVVKLSGMMRYAVSESDRPMVSLEREIAYLNNYIELQMFRLTDKVKMKCSIAEDKYGHQIAPFLLIPFVENAFKYGVSPEDDSDILIELVVTDGGVVLKTLNRKVQIKQGHDEHTGLGISTTRRRLELLYAGKYVLQVEDGEEDFSVLLNIQLV